MPFKHLGLYEGIGGFSVAAEAVGWETVAWCEWDKFCQQVLKYYFPKAKPFGDIDTSDFSEYADTIDVLTAGFPCQPFSIAGKRKGTADDRNKWPQTIRAVRQIRPRYFVGENVRGLINWDAGMVFNQVQIDLEAEGYEILPFLLPAAGVNAPHERYRVWFVAHSNSIRRNGVISAGNGIQWDETRGKVGASDSAPPPTNAGEGNEGSSNDTIKREGPSFESFGERLRDEFSYDDESRIVTNSNIIGGGDRTGRENRPEVSNGDEQIDAHTGGAGREELDASAFADEQEHGARRIITDWSNWPTEPGVCVGNDGVPPGLDIKAISKAGWRNASIKAAGNAIVPQEAIQIFKAIIEYEKLQLCP